MSGDDKRNWRVAAARVTAKKLVAIVSEFDALDERTADRFIESVRTVAREMEQLLEAEEP